MPSDDLLERLALEYHRQPRPGKIAVVDAQTRGRGEPG
jgi:hypothetical protein